MVNVINVQHVSNLNKPAVRMLHGLHKSVRPETATMSEQEYGEMLKRYEIFYALGHSSNPAEVGQTVPVVGFALVLQVRETFMRHKARIDELIVNPESIGQLQLTHHDIGSKLLSRIEEYAMQWRCDALTTIIDQSINQAQPLFASARWNAVALYFSAPVHQLDKQSNDQSINQFQSLVITQDNFDSDKSQSLMIQAHSIYQQLRPDPIQIPHEVDEYIKALRDIITQGPTFLVIASESNIQSKDQSIDQSTVLGLAMCRPMINKLHIDDLVTNQTSRSRGVGSFLIQTIARLISDNDAIVAKQFDHLIQQTINHSINQSDEQSNSQTINHTISQSIKEITLESGFQRLDAHRFYWREGFLATGHYWRKQVIIPKLD